ncbi:MAG TPA: hypothetical protein DCL54_07015 [Alphaproteobacteria bacterium]|nr:hypothetical protein [Alphaproteobacteria bacterium]HAJ46314.1 hypothetical protein [Alphaproteobacteria bacterium]
MRFVTLVAALALAVPASATVKWTPDYSASSLGFKGSFGQNTVDGTFSKYTAEVLFDKGNLAGSKIKVVVDTGSVKSTTSPDNYNEETTTALPGAGWLNVAKFPQATFETTSITAKGGDNFEAKGNLTVVGQTQEVVLPFTVKIDGTTATATGKTTVNRMKFGIKGDKPLFALPKPVPHEVEISFTLKAKK